ncbi:hypothetical protein HIM_02509 [Hirsutella minnesotensis 3608]|nr:hypothetical protein HIM_02509 [Hirsutella minnesotensis 3608]
MAIIRVALALLCALQTACSLASSVAADEPGHEKRADKHPYVNMAFWPYQATRKLSEANAGNITHLIYTSAKVSDDGYVEHRDRLRDVGIDPRKDISRSHLYDAAINLI